MSKPILKRLINLGADPKALSKNTTPVLTQFQLDCAEKRDKFYAARNNKDFEVRLRLALAAAITNFSHDLIGEVFKFLNPREQLSPTERIALADSLEHLP